MEHRPTLIIVPGWAGSHETWQDFMMRAGSNFIVHCIDLPCFGGVPCPSEVWGVEEYAAYVEHEVRKIAEQSPQLHEKPILLGHSFGGQVSLKVVSDHPELFSALVLSAPAIIRPFRPLSRAFFFVIAKTGKFLFRLPVIEKASVWAKKVLYRAASSPDYTNTSEIQRDIFKKIIRQDLQYLLSKITLPTLVMWGTRDSYLPVRDAKKISNQIRGAQIRIFPGGRHGLHIQFPREMLETIVAFVRNTSSV